MICPKLIVFLVAMYVAETRPTTDSQISISDTVKELKQHLKLTEVQVWDLKRQNEDLKTKLETLTQGLKTVAIAFSASLRPRNIFEYIGPFENDFTLKYENVITNVGGAYNPWTGVFAVPVKGVYFFTFVIFNPYRYASGAMLMKNGQMVVSATNNVPGAADSEDTTSNSVSLVLEPLDQVYMLMPAGRAIYTDGLRRNTFSGHLLHAM